MTNSTRTNTTEPINLNEIIYAGHSAIILKNPTFCVAIDPWLQDNPTCPAELKDPGKIDLIVLTHGHPDHAGDVLRLGKLYNSQLIATYELAQAIINDGYDENLVLPMNKGGTSSIAGLQITLTHALHSNSYTGKQGTVYAGEACGVVIKSKNNTFYHAGDTCLFSDMELIGKHYKPDYAFLPIGDHFTMGPQEAAEAAKLIGARTSIPIHHSTFGLLTGSPQSFQECCADLGLSSKILAPGEKL